jgi:hypothetical protein
MDLVRKAREGEEVQITEDIARLLKSPNESVIASVQTIKPEYGSKDITIAITGLVTYDTRMIQTIPARTGGRLESVNLNYVYQPVTKGQKVAEIYSPELVTAQRELLFLVMNDAGNTALIESAKRKLFLLGMTEAQVNSILNKKEPITTVSVYSNYNGYVITNSQQAPIMTSISTANASASGGMNSMSGSPAPVSPASNSSSPSAEIIREGNYVSSGQTLFTIVNPASLRIELNVPVSQAGSIKKGDALQLDYANNEKENAVVDFVQPYFSEGEEFLKIRVIIKKLNNVRIGQLVSASLTTKSAEVYWVPSDVVFDSGVDNIVFVKERGSFKPKKIITGLRTGGWIEIKNGLASSDEIATQANYLIDSESFVKAK